LTGVTTSLHDIQTELLSLLTPSAVLVGHSLESDLNALKMTHPFIVDTALLYPHPRGLPLRSSLKFLANKYLKREIQQGTNGHDSVEDSRAALDLVRLKCEKGKMFGVADANGESIFSRFSRSGHRTAMVDYGRPERGFGQHATVRVGCDTDEEIVEGVRTTLSKDENHDERVSFLWARLRGLEFDKEHSAGQGVSAQGSTQDAPATDHQDSRTARQKTLQHLKDIYTGLPDDSLFMVYPGPSDVTEVLRLQEMHKAYQREFRVKKWDELTVQWTDNEAQALRKAFDLARQGSALIGLK
jgi:RNA exonuclease 1